MTLPATGMLNLQQVARDLDKRLAAVEAELDAIRTVTEAAANARPAAEETGAPEPAAAH